MPEAARTDTQAVLEGEAIIKNPSAEYVVFCLVSTAAWVLGLDSAFAEWRNTCDADGKLASAWLCMVEPDSTLIQHSRCAAPFASSERQRAQRNVLVLLWCMGHFELRGGNR